MENQSPFTAEPFATKRSDGKVEACLTTYKSWLPMFYLLPKEYVQKRSVYLSLPRCPYAIWNTHQYDELVNSRRFSGNDLGFVCLGNLELLSGAG